MLKYAFDGSVKTPEPDWTGVPLAYKGKCSAVCHSMTDIEGLVHWFDSRADFCPDMPILLLIPGIEQPIAVCGMGFATVAELRDACRETWELKSARMAKDGRLHDFDDLRERSGLVERSKVAEMAQYAFWDRVRRHKASPITDPFKQFKYPNPKQRTTFVQPGNEGWKA